MISFTYGVMPSHEQFLEACAKEDPNTGQSVDDDGFAFGNDKRVGSTNLSTAKLWDELQQANSEFQAEGNEAAGDWCSCVLYCLGFEWI